MIVEKEGYLYAVHFQGDGTADVYPLGDVMSSNVSFPGVPGELAASRAVDSFLDRHVVVKGKKYLISDDEHYTQITLEDGEFFTEADWEGPMADSDAIQLIREKLKENKKFADYAAERAQNASPEEAASVGVFDADYAKEKFVVVCGCCGGSGFLPRSETGCPVCKGAQVLSEEADYELIEKICGKFNEVNKVDGIYWSCSTGGASIFASSPGYPDLELELDFEDSAFEGSPITREMVRARIAEELEWLDEED